MLMLMADLKINTFSEKGVKKKWIHENDKNNICQQQSDIQSFMSFNFFPSHKLHILHLRGRKPNMPSLQELKLFHKLQQHMKMFAHLLFLSLAFPCCHLLSLSVPLILYGTAVLRGSSKENVYRQRGCVHGCGELCAYMAAEWCVFTVCLNACMWLHQCVCACTLKRFVYSRQCSHVCFFFFFMTICAHAHAHAHATILS